ncbi:MAG: hypothetical protein QXV97_07515 [Candidatus Caldarchaeum sp.]
MSSSLSKPPAAEKPEELVETGEVTGFLEDTAFTVTVGVCCWWRSVMEHPVHR